MMKLLKGALMGAGVVLAVIALATFPIGGVMVGNYLWGQWGAILGLAIGTTITGSIVGAIISYFE